MQDTKGKQTLLNPPSVDQIKAFFGLYIATNDLIVTPSDHGLFIQNETKWLSHTPGFRTVFTCKRFEETKHFIHFSDTYEVIGQSLTMIPYTRLVLLLIIYRRNLKVYVLQSHRFLLTKLWYLLKADWESNSLFPAKLSVSVSNGGNSASPLLATVINLTGIWEKAKKQMTLSLSEGLPLLL